MTVDPMMDEFDFSGSEGAKVAQESNKGGDFQREIEYLSLKGDEASVQQRKNQIVLRFVTEFERKPWMDGYGTTPYNLAWITVAEHSYTPTKPRPPYVKQDGWWPEHWSAVCRRDKVFARKYNNDCWLCANYTKKKPSDRSYALAVEREPVIENGQVIGYRDKTREVLARDAEGKAIVEREEGEKKYYAKKIVPAWIIVNQGWKNFFQPLSNNGQYFGTILDADWVVTRTGTKNNDTAYGFIRLDPIMLPEGNPYGMPAGSKYDLGAIVANAEDGRPIPLAEVLYPEMPDLRRIIASKTTDDYYGRYFVPGWLPEGFDPSQAQNGQQAPSGGYAPPQGQQGGYQPPQAQQQPQQAPDPAQPTPQGNGQAAPSTSTLDALRSRVMGATSGAQQQ